MNKMQKTIVAIAILFVMTIIVYATEPEPEDPEKVKAEIAGKMDYSKLSKDELLNLINGKDKALLRPLDNTPPDLFKELTKDEAAKFLEKFGEIKGLTPAEKELLDKLGGPLGRIVRPGEGPREVKLSDLVGDEAAVRVFTQEDRVHISNPNLIEFKGELPKLRGQFDIFEFPKIDFRNPDSEIKIEDKGAIQFHPLTEQDLRLLRERPEDVGIITDYQTFLCKGVPSCLDRLESEKYK